MEAARPVVVNGQAGCASTASFIIRPNCTMRARAPANSCVQEGGRHSEQRISAGGILACAAGRGVQ